MQQVYTYTANFISDYIINTEKIEHSQMLALVYVHL